MSQHVTPFLKRFNSLERTWSQLRLGLNRAIKEASKFFLVLVIIDAVDKIDHLNVCVGNFIKCFDGSESPSHFPCSLILIVHFSLLHQCILRRTSNHLYKFCTRDVDFCLSKERDYSFIFRKRFSRYEFEWRFYWIILRIVKGL